MSILKSAVFIRLTASLSVFLFFGSIMAGSTTVSAQQYEEQTYVGTHERPPSVKKAEHYLRGLNTAKARFLQTIHDGTQFIGTFYLNRPGRLRFEYDDPIDDFVVADGRFIYFYDSELEEQSNALIGQTLADFILRKDLRLDGDIMVANITRSGGLLHIKLVQKSDPLAGSLTLGFEENPMRLKKWRVVDAQGAVTEIELFQFETGMTLPDSLFIYKDPKHGDSIPEWND